MRLPLQKKTQNVLSSYNQRSDTCEHDIFSLLLLPVGVPGRSCVIYCQDIHIFVKCYLKQQSSQLFQHNFPRLLEAWVCLKNKTRIISPLNQNQCLFFLFYISFLHAYPQLSGKPLNILPENSTMTFPVKPLLTFPPLACCMLLNCCLDPFTVSGRQRLWVAHQLSLGGQIGACHIGSPCKYCCHSTQHWAPVICEGVNLPKEYTNKRAVNRSYSPCVLGIQHRTWCIADIKQNLSQ